MRVVAYRCPGALRQASVKNYRYIGPRVDYTDALAEARAVIVELEATGERPLLAFSGGKDSIVSCHIARSFGHRRAACDTSLVFLRSIADSRMIADALELKVTWIDRFGRDLPARDSRWLFPPTKKAGGLYALRQQKTVKLHAKRHGYGAIIYGRRKAENTVKSPLYRLKSGLLQCNPIRNWSLEQVWTYIRDHELPTPAIYNDSIGQKYGAIPWSLMNAEWLRHWKADATLDDVWRMIGEFDLATLQEQARWHAGARTALAALGGTS